MRSEGTKTRRPSRGFFCSACGNESLRWFGQCPSCGAWNTLAEAPEPVAAPGPPGAARGAGGARGGRNARGDEGPSARRRWVRAGTGASERPRPLVEVELEHRARTPIGNKEHDS